MTEELSSQSKTNFASVVLAIRNEAKSIEGTLQAILDQDYSQECYEIIVADGMSSDGTREKIHDLQQKYSNIHLLDNEEKIVSTGLNKAIAQAKGDVIVRVDGHTRIAPDYVRMCIELLKKYESVDNVGGRMVPEAKSIVGKAVALATSTPFGIGNAHFHYVDEERFVDTVYMGAWRKSLFDEVGKFDEKLVRNQDDEFNYRLLDHDKQILLSPKLKSTYTPRESLIALWKQYFQYGFWKVKVMQKHPEQMRLRQFVPPLFVASSVLLGLLSFFPYFSKLFWSLVGAYLVANIASSVYFTLGKDKSFNPFIPFVYGVLHVSYGAGFILGCLNKVKDNAS